jgi:hypothetical protein
MVLGSAQSFVPGSTFTEQVLNIGATGGTSATVNLIYGATGGGVNFDAGTHLFTVPVDGKYLITYGLSCDADDQVVTDYGQRAAKVWVGVHKITGIVGTDLGSVPLNLSGTVPSNETGGEASPLMLSGYGQLQVDLEAGDTLGLKLFGSGSGATAANVTIGPDQLQDPAVLLGLNNGGTLSVMLIATD